MKNTGFYRMIHLRGLTTSMLAKAAGCGRCHLTEVLNGSRQGIHTWPKLRLVLSAEEYECAKKHALEQADLSGKLGQGST